MEAPPVVPCLAFSSPGLVGGCDDGGDPTLICLKMPSWSVVAAVNDLYNLGLRLISSLLRNR